MSTEFLDKQFIKEFNTVCKQLKSVRPFNIQDITIPTDVIPRPDLTKKILIKDIKDKYISKLNDSIVDWYKNRTIDRNVYWNSGEVRRVESYTVPTGSQIIRTDKPIELPAKYKYEEKGLEYIDYTDVDGQRYWYYSIPERNLYEVVETALVISERLKPQHYGGVRVVSTYGYPFYMYIVGIKNYKKVESQKVITTGIDIDYKAEINLLLNYWINIGLIFNPDDLEVSIPINKFESTNLALTRFEPVLEFDNTSDYSMAEQKSNSRNIFS